MKSGIVASKCQLLSNGEVFWGPKALKHKCPPTPLCLAGTALVKNIVDGRRHCCCIIKDLKPCPPCEMTYASRMPFWYWFNVQVARIRGPPDGFCKPDRVKRILIEKGKSDVCCCEPRTSPFVPEEMKERRTSETPETTTTTAATTV